MKIYIDQGVNQKYIKQLRRDIDFTLINGHSNEERIKGVMEVAQPFRLDMSTLDGGDFLVGDNYTQMAKVIGKNSPQDADHLYTAYAAGCDYFITNNPKDFIRSVRKNPSSTGKREQLEKILSGIKIVTLEEFKKIVATQAE